MMTPVSKATEPRRGDPPLQSKPGEGGAENTARQKFWSLEEMEDRFLSIRCHPDGCLYVLHSNQAGYLILYADGRVHWTWLRPGVAKAVEIPDGKGRAFAFYYRVGQAGLGKDPLVIRGGKTCLHGGDDELELRCDRFTGKWDVWINVP